MTTPSETKVQRHERIKGEQNPWDELPRLLQAFRSGIDAIAKEDLDVRLRWWGLYTQGDGEGAFGDAVPFFMMRVRIPNGLLTATQLATLSSITARYARGIADITVRQNLQLHWIRAEDIPEIFEQLWACGLTTQAACGDDTRNVTGCPLAGIDPEEIVDASPLARAVNDALSRNAEYYNLPRKFKICVTGCRQWCPNPQINDVALTAHRRNGELGFALRVGGGLSTTPMLAKALPVFITPEQVVPVAKAIAQLFRDRDELRQNRARARLKFLFLQHNWTPERFRDEVEARLGFKLADGEPDEPPPAEFFDHLGVHPQHQPGLYYVGVSVLRGRITADELAAASEAAAEFGNGEVRTTAMQNLVIPHVTWRNVDSIRRVLERADLPVDASAFRRGTIACTGKEFCKLAVTETKAFAVRLVDELERRLDGFPVPIKINLNGCPNSCGQHWIADIGLQGMRAKTSAGPADAFDVFLGGGLGRTARIARKTLGRVLASELPDKIEAVLRVYLHRRGPGESFQEFVMRIGEREIEALLGTVPAFENPELVALANAKVPAHVCEE